MPTNKLKTKDLITLQDLSSSDILKILKFAQKLKKQKKATPLLKGKTLAMIFEKPSTRTRVSFEVGMFQLGGLALNLDPESVQIGERESLTDVARTLSRYVNGIMLRTFSHAMIMKMAEYATVPVINGLSDKVHPCQALGDVLTILEHKKKLKGIKIAYIGDGNNVCNSLMYASEKLGIELVVASPEGYEPKIKVKPVTITNDPEEAVSDADVIYTDVWASMGQESETQERKEEFFAFQINKKLLRKAKKNAIVMHCLPAHRGDEITDDVIDGPQSVVFDQAENRLHAQKAVMALLMG